MTVVSVGVVCVGVVNVVLVLVVSTVYSTRFHCMNLLQFLKIEASSIFTFTSCIEYAYLPGVVCVVCVVLVGVVSVSVLTVVLLVEVSMGTVVVTALQEKNTY